MKVKRKISAERDYLHLEKPIWNEQEKGKERRCYGLSFLLFIATAAYDDDDDCYPAMMKYVVTPLNDARLQDEDKNDDLWRPSFVFECE